MGSSAAKEKVLELQMMILRNFVQPKGPWGSDGDETEDRVARWRRTRRLKMMLEEDYKVRSDVKLIKSEMMRLPWPVDRTEEIKRNRFIFQLRDLIDKHWERYRLDWCENDSKSE